MEPALSTSGSHLSTATASGHASPSTPPFILPTFTGKLDVMGLTRAANLAQKVADREEVEYALQDINAVLFANKENKQILKHKRNELYNWLARKDENGIGLAAASQSLSSTSSSDESAQQENNNKRHRCAGDPQAGIAESKSSSTVVLVWPGRACNQKADTDNYRYLHFSNKERKLAQNDPDPVYRLLAAARVGCGSCVCELLNQGVSVHSTTKQDGWGVWDQAHFYKQKDDLPNYELVIRCIESAGGRATEAYRAYLLKTESKHRR